MSKIIVVTGQTASGKSKYALNLAKEINGIIINSDAIQIYKENKILAATPKTDFVEGIEHKLYGFINGSKHFSVMEWVDLISLEVNNALSNNKLPIIVGGSPMYNRILIDGINEIPNIPNDIIESTQEEIDALGNEEIYKKLYSLDPLSEQIEWKNTNRLLRAYRVFLTTKKSIFTFHKEQKKSVLSGFEVQKIIINTNKEKLQSNCQERFKKMIEDGAIQEVKNLYNMGYQEDIMIFKTIGVREIKEHLDGRISLDEAIFLSITKTLQYAKKQATWFNNKFPDFAVIKIT